MSFRQTSSDPSRRTLMTGAGALGLAGCVGALLSGCKVPRVIPPVGVIDGPGRGLWLQSADGQTRALSLGGDWDGAPFTLDTPFRVASISKVLVAELARRLDADGRLDRDVDVGAALGLTGARALRHPDHPATPITLRHLLSHQSGIRDPDIYWMAAPGDIRALIDPTIWEPGGEPGRTFRYSNFNYGLAATVMEIATGERFDRLFTTMIAAPLGLDIGFNWSGVSAARRATAYPGLRGSGEDWTVQIDDADMRSAPGPAILTEDGFDVRTYVAGTNGTLFSPQGGLRASLRDLAVIARDVVLPQPDLLQPLWSWNGQPRDGGPSEGGHFIAFGDGVYLYPADRSPLPGRRLIGHHGEAYGIYCGMWADPESGDILVHADLGSPPDGSPMAGGVPNLTAAASSAFAAWRSTL